MAERRVNVSWDIMDHPLVGVVGGSRSDFPILERPAPSSMELEIPTELRVVSAHRTPDHLFRYAEEATGRGLRVIVAGAGGAAHLPGMLAAKTILPVIGVPIPTQHLGGLDSLLSIVQMPRGDPGRDRGDRQCDERRIAGRRDPRPVRRGPGRAPGGLARARPRASSTIPRTPRADLGACGGRLELRFRPAPRCPEARPVAVLGQVERRRRSAILSTTRIARAAAGAPVKAMAMPPTMIVMCRTTRRPYGANICAAGETRRYSPPPR